MNSSRFLYFTLGFAALFLSVAFFARAVDSDDVSGSAGRTVSALEEDVKHDPTNFELWRHLGFAYRKAGQINDAQKAFEKVTMLNPKEHEAYFMLGLIYESKHMTAEAKKAWQQYLIGETDPDKRAIAEKHIHHLTQ